MLKRVLAFLLSLILIVGVFPYATKENSKPVKAAASDYRGWQVVPSSLSFGQIYASNSIAHNTTKNYAEFYRGNNISTAEADLGYGPRNFKLAHIADDDAESTYAGKAPLYRYTITEVSATGGFKAERLPISGGVTLFWKYDNKSSESKTHVTSNGKYKNEMVDCHTDHQTNKNGDSRTDCYVYYQYTRHNDYGNDNPQQKAALYTRIRVTPPDASKLTSNDVTGKITVKYKYWKNGKTKKVWHALDFNENNESYSHPGDWVVKTKTFTVHAKTKSKNIVQNNVTAGTTVYTRNNYTYNNIREGVVYTYDKELKLGGYTAGKGYGGSSGDKARFNIGALCNDNKLNGAYCRFVGLTHTNENDGSFTYENLNQVYEHFGRSGTWVTFEDEGSYTLTCRDLLNNKDFSVKWVVDNNPPEIQSHNGSIYSNSKELYFNDDASITWYDKQGVYGTYLERGGWAKVGGVIKYAGFEMPKGSDNSSDVEITKEGNYYLLAKDNSGNTNNIYAIVDKIKPKAEAVEIEGLSYQYTTKGNFVDDAGNELLAKSEVPYIKENGTSKVDIELANAIILNKRANLGVVLNNNREEFLYKVWSFGSKLKEGTDYKIDNEGNVNDSKGKLLIPVDEVPSKKDSLKKRIFALTNGMYIYNTGVKLTMNDVINDSTSADNLAGTKDNVKYYCQGCSGIAKVEIESDDDYAVYELPDDPYVFAGCVDGKNNYDYDVKKYNTAYKEFSKGLSDFGTITSGFNTNGKSNFGVIINKSGTYEVTVTDKAGNETTTQFKVNTKVPQIEGVEDGGIYPGEVTADFVYDDPDDFKHALIDKVPWYQMSYTFEETEPNNGWHNIMLFSNNTPVVPEVDFQIDLLKPEYLIKQSNGKYNERTRNSEGFYTKYKDGDIIKDGDIFNKSIVFKMQEDNPLQLFIDGVLRSPGELTVGEDINSEALEWIVNQKDKYFHPSEYEIATEGEHTIVSTDLAGHTNKVTFIIDKTAPTLSYSGDVNGGSDNSVLYDYAYVNIEDENEVANKTKLQVLDVNGNWLNAEAFDGTADEDSASVSFIADKTRNKLKLETKKIDGKDYTIETFRVIAEDKAGNSVTEQFKLAHHLTEMEEYDGYNIYDITSKGTYTFKITQTGKKDRLISNIEVDELETDADGNYVTPEYIKSENLKSNCHYKAFRLIVDEKASIEWEALETKTPAASISGTEGIYRTAKTITVNSGTATLLYSSGPTIKKPVKKTYKAGQKIKASKQGTYVVSYTNKYGDTTESEFVIDKTKPKMSLKKGKKYKKGKVLSISDKLSGVKTVKVNGKKQKKKNFEKIKLKKKGKVKIVATDYAGNTLKTYVKIK